MGDDQVIVLAWESWADAEVVSANIDEEKDSI